MIYFIKKLSNKLFLFLPIFPFVFFHDIFSTFQTLCKVFALVKWNGGTNMGGMSVLCRLPVFGKTCFECLTVFG